MMQRMRLTHIKAIFISGVTWLVIGSLLLYKGLYYLVMCLFDQPIPLTHLSGWVGGVQNGILLLVALGLVIGFMKGRYVLSKTVRKVTHKIILQPSPLHLKDVYSKRYLLLIGSMMILGMAMRIIPIGNDIRGLIDTAIGFALMNGALLYFRLALALKNQT